MEVLKTSENVELSKQIIIAIPEHVKLCLKEQRQVFILYLVNNWLSNMDEFFTQKTLNQFLCYLEVIAISVVTDKSASLLIIPTIIYADKYIKKTKTRLTRQNVYYLLSISLTLSIKFWTDDKFFLDNASRALDIPKEKIMELEFKLLDKINWDLFLSKEDLQTYQINNLWSTLFQI